MFVWWVIGLIGYSCLGITYCQEMVTDLLDIEPNEEVTVSMSIDTMPSDSTVTVKTDVVSNAIAYIETTTITTTSAPVSLSCLECVNCHLKPAVTTRVCDTGVTMCFKMNKLINNVSRLVRSGCATSKGLCTAPDDDQSNSYESITCCKSHKCNHSTQAKLSLFLSPLSLFIMLITIINM